MVKTPAHPVAVLPPELARRQLEGGMLRRGVCALHLDNSGRLQASR